MAGVDDSVREAGRRVLAESGWHATTVERVAAAAGLSRVTLHRRGFTKELLLQALVEEAVEDYRRRMWPALVADGDGAARLELALHALCDAAEEHMGLLLALQAKTGEVFHDEDDEVLTRTVFSEPLERLLAEGRSDGSLRVEDPAEEATVLFNLVGWTYIHLRDGHRWAPGRARASVLRIALDGLRAG